MQYFLLYVLYLLRPGPNLIFEALLQRHLRCNIDTVQSHMTDATTVKSVNMNKSLWTRSFTWDWILYFSVEWHQ